MNALTPPVLPHAPRSPLRALALCSLWCAPALVWGQAAAPAESVPAPAAPVAAQPAPPAAPKAGAQAQAAPTPAPKNTTDLNHVEIRSSRATERRAAPASAIVIGREEIEKQGDATIGEVLKRLPGVTMQGAPGRGGAIRMRGMGSGYTQVLIDGERAPPGFSIDQLTPEQVERIEIMRSPTAETGARAIAGTINIVLREGQKGQKDDLKLTATHEHGRTSAQLNGVHHLQGEGLAGSLTLALLDVYRPEESLTATAFEPEDATTPNRERQSQATGHRRAVNASARLQWRGEAGRSLVLTPFVVYSDYEREGHTAVRTTSGAPLADQAQVQGNSIFSLARLNGQWAQRLSADDRLELTFGLGQSRYNARTEQSGAQELRPFVAPLLATQPLLRNGVVAQAFVDRSHNLKGKWTRALDSGHQIVSGLEWEQVRRQEDGAASGSDETGPLAASTLRRAIYAQDEFKINPQWSAYAGLRWEQLHTTGVDAGDTKRHASQVWTPLLHAAYKPDPQKRDQVRVSLTRSYKSPSLHQLVARYSPTLGDNSWTQPDRAGNPNLRPELATGIDVGFERYLEAGGVLGINLFQRRLNDVIRDATTWNGSRYVSAPTNAGRATTQGIEWDAKFRLNQWWPEALPIDVRTNLSFFSSRVHSVPGPNNRLDQQPNATGNLGGDYRLRGLPLTLGGNINWNPAYDSRRTPEQWTHQGAKRVLDVYGLWRVSAASGVRLTISNATPLPYVTGTRFEAAGQTETATTRTANWRSVQLRWELKL